MIQVLIQRHAIKTVIQPGSKKLCKCYLMLPKKRVQIDEGLSTTYEKSLHAKGQKIQAHCPLTFCVAFLHMQKGYTGLGPEKNQTHNKGIVF